jgi:integrase
VIRYLLPEEEPKLREAIQEQCPHHMPELYLALNTGMRQGEQYNLTWENIDMDRRLITIPRSKHGDPRHIELNDIALGLSGRRIRKQTAVPMCSLTATARNFRNRASGSKRQ